LTRLTKTCRDNGDGTGGVLNSETVAAASLGAARALACSEQLAHSRTKARLMSALMLLWSVVLYLCSICRLNPPLFFTPSGQPTSSRC